MSANQSAEPRREAWENEIAAGHRWGGHPERVARELDHLRLLRQTAEPLTAGDENVMQAIVSLEICNWRCEEAIMALIRAIGLREAPAIPIGHMASMTEDRWRRIWAYYLVVAEWCAALPRHGFTSMLVLCDPDQSVRRHVRALLGAVDERKRLYARRFCLCLEHWLDGFPDSGPAAQARAAAAASLERAIREIDPQAALLSAFAHEGDGKLNPCHHKLFRRYDIILSSIGAGAWRAAMPCRGTDGFARAAGIDELLRPVAAWLADRGEPLPEEDATLFHRVHGWLGARDAAKTFLVSLLLSLLAAQQESAVRRAQRAAPHTRGEEP